MINELNGMHNLITGQNNGQNKNLSGIGASYFDVKSVVQIRN